MPTWRRGSRPARPSRRARTRPGTATCRRASSSTRSSGRCSSAAASARPDITVSTSRSARCSEVAGIGESGTRAIRRSGRHTMSVTLGSDRLFDSGALKGRRIGVVANPASVDGAFRHVVDRAAAAAGRDARRGVRSAARLPGRPAGQHDRVAARARRAAARAGLLALQRDARADRRDAGRPRRARHRPAGRRRADLHLRLHDGELPAGGRAGTACRSIVCDRPNPIGGVGVEGPMLEPGFESFVGLFPIPMRHGMTIGELARLFNEAFGIGADLEVVPLGGWQREMYWDETGLPWVMPVAQHADARHGDRLPGRRAVRGHAAVGGPRHDAAVRAGRRAVDRRRAVRRAAERDAASTGAFFRPVVFEPTFHKHARQACGGCQIHVTDRARVPARAGRRSPRWASSTGRRPTASPGASRPTSTCTTGCRSTSSPARTRLRRGDRSRRAGARHRRGVGRRASRRSTRFASGSCSTERRATCDARCTERRAVSPELR